MEKLPNQLKCPACNDHQWELRSLEETLGIVPDKQADVPPIIPIMCRCCGHLSFFFTKAMDLT
jgi:hypothetical protein